MAGSAVIGALRVNLGLDSAEFEAGLRKAQSGLAGFGKAAAAGFATAAATAVAAGAALALASKHAIDTADAMSKTAQKVGVTTEALSRLNYAAGYSDVSLEQLSGGLQKLSKNLADVASGKGGAAATALQALGISATDSSGQLRNADVVFAEIADRFGRLEDGSTKTAVAMQLFGKTGAELIPLLNTGRDGLAQMADESDRLGLTISTSTGRAAEQFNDTLAKVGRIVEGVAMKVAEAALPALQRLADTLASPQVAQAAQTLGTALVGAFDLVVQAVTNTTNAISGFLDWLRGLDGGQGPLINQMLPGEKLNFADAIRSSSVRANSGYPIPGSSYYGGFEFGGNGQMVIQPPAASGLSLPTFGGGGTDEGLQRRLEALRETLRTEEESERASFERRKAEIQKFYDEGLIQRGEYDDLLLRAQEEHSERMIEIARQQAEEEMRLREQLVSNVASIFGSLSTIAENMGDKNLGIAKAFAVAEAIMNTAQGITKALAQGGIFGFVGAAAVAAAGAAQISTILSTQKGSSSRPSVRGGGAEVSTPAVNAPAQSAPGTAVNVTLVGGGRYSRNEVEALLRDINDALGDGAKLNIQGA